MRKVNTLTLFLILLLFVLIDIAFYFGTITYKRSLDKVLVEIDTLNIENTRLKSEYSTLLNPTRIEKVAKEKLKMIEVKNFYVVELEAK